MCMMYLKEKQTKNLIDQIFFLPAFSSGAVFQKSTFFLIWQIQYACHERNICAKFHLNLLNKEVNEDKADGMRGKTNEKIWRLKHLKLFVQETCT